MRIRAGLLALAAALPYLGSSAAALAAGVDNLTGLPLYPDVNSATMDRVARTDKMGHWCNRFQANTSASLDTVEAWYRKNLFNPSETDLKNDERYRGYENLVGVKLALGIDFVAVFTTGNGVTTIELFKCSPST